MIKRLCFPSIILLFLMNTSRVFGQQNVGIGTLTPQTRLDVQGDAASNSHLIRAQVNYIGAADIIAVNGISNPAAGTGSGGEFTGGLAGVEAYGTGTSSAGPSYGLFASATGTTGVRYGVYGTASGGATNYGLYGTVSGGTNFYAVYGNNTNAAGYAGYFNGRGRFVQDLYADANVGIGTTTPVAKLNIIGGADVSLTTNGFAQFGTTASWNLILDDNEIMARNNGAGNDLFIQNDAGNILMCGNEQGKVGIGLTAGTSIPTGYLFAVDGKIIAEEMRIQNSANWPDYVFDSQYELMPIDALKASIETHKHLPKIPSAAQVQEEGILLGDMQKKMMEKIEELTLYIIDLHDANRKLREEVDELRKLIGDR